MNSSRITAESQPVTRNSPSPSSASFSSRRLRQRSDGILLELTQDRDRPRQARSGNQKKAELAVFDYIETFYNPTRRHSSLDQISPVAFENQQQQNDNIAAELVSTLSRQALAGAVASGD
jgi:transposase InsO family protein